MSLEKELWAEGRASAEARGWKELGRGQNRAGEVGKGKVMQDLIGFPTEVIFTKAAT